MNSRQTIQSALFATSMLFAVCTADVGLKSDFGIANRSRWAKLLGVDRNNARFPKFRMAAGWEPSETGPAPSLIGKALRKGSAASETKTVVGKLLIQRWYGAAWSDSAQRSYQYDSTGLVSQESEQLWKSSNGVWVDSEKIQHDNQSQSVVELTQDWNTTLGQWLNLSRDSIAFDLKDRALSKMYWDWNTTIGVWAKSSRTTWSYDDVKATVEVSGEDWNTTLGTWDKSWTAHQQLNQNGDILIAEIKVWNSSTSEWENYLKRTVAYDAQNRPTEDVTQTWNDTYSAWGNVYRQLEKYDEKGNNPETDFDSWNTSIGAWVPYEKIAAAYDTKDNRVEEISSEWQTSSQQWTQRLRYSYTFTDVIASLLPKQSAHKPGNTLDAKILDRMAGLSSIELIDAHGRTLASIPYRGLETLERLKRETRGGPAILRLLGQNGTILALSRFNLR